jgi:hypothetical protein
MTSSPNASNGVGWWILAIISALLGLMTLYINVSLTLAAVRGGIESAQWQFGLVPLFAFGILAAIASGNSIAHRPGKFPKLALPALIVVNAIFMVFLVFKARA